MNKPLLALTARLKYGTSTKQKRDDISNGFIETLAGVYEKARNALEYRAENLVRRAAIERILKRRIILNKDPVRLADRLLKELIWAKYLTLDEVKAARRSDLEKVLSKYVQFLGGKVPQEWVIKIASAEIEELFNLNTDYKQFTFYAFQVMLQKIQITNTNLDLLVYFATDKVYAESDDEQIAYHILSLAGEQISKEKFEEAWQLYKYAKRSTELPRITKYVRRQMPPLVLLRDIYFYDPSNFKKIITSEENFRTLGEEVLQNQIGKMSERISTAGIRSVLYVFLTKMILAFGMEVPFELFFYDRVAKLPLIINLLFPPFIMWVSTMQIKLPSKKEKSNLLDRTWYIIQNFDTLKAEEDALKDTIEVADQKISYHIFSVLYSIFFVGIFAGIITILGKIGYTPFSEIIFIFFLTIIAFFAYRILQITKVYSYRDSQDNKPSFIDIISLPILTIGSRLSMGLSKLNFLAFAFDFILEAPFKLILGFVDEWIQFLSTKKEEQIID